MFYLNLYHGKDHWQIPINYNSQIAVQERKMINWIFLQLIYIIKPKLKLCHLLKPDSRKYRRWNLVGTISREIVAWNKPNADYWWQDLFRFILIKSNCQYLTSYQDINWLCSTLRIFDGENNVIMLWIWVHIFFKSIMIIIFDEHKIDNNRWTYLSLFFL